MIILQEKIQNIYNKLSFLLSQFRSICVKTFNLLPKQIYAINVGTNKLSSYFNRSLQEVTSDDLEGVTEINSSMFDVCNTSLTSITIPDSVTGIGYQAFEYCTSLKDMYMHRTTPPILNNNNAIPLTTTIHVPIGSGEAYKTATNWSYHATRIVEDIEI